MNLQPWLSWVITHKFKERAHWSCVFSLSWCLFCHCKIFLLTFDILVLASVCLIFVGMCWICNAKLLLLMSWYLHVQFYWRLSSGVSSSFQGVRLDFRNTIFSVEKQSAKDCFRQRLVAADAFPGFTNIETWDGFNFVDGSMRNTAKQMLVAMLASERKLAWKATGERLWQRSGAGIEAIYGAEAIVSVLF